MVRGYTDLRDISVAALTCFSPSDHFPLHSLASPRRQGIDNAHSSMICQCSCYLWERAARDRLGTICCDFSEESRDITTGSEYQSCIHSTRHTPNYMFRGAIYHHVSAPSLSLHTWTLSCLPT